jgi:hypothetical protein
MERTPEEVAIAYAKGIVGRRLMDDKPLEPMEILEIREMLNVQKTLLIAGYYASSISRYFAGDEVRISARKIPSDRVEERLAMLLDDEALLEGRLEARGEDRSQPQEHGHDPRT